MGLRINSNIAAINTHRQLFQSGIQLDKALEKLSSGLRVNRASDDAANLSISETLRAQVRGLRAASRNVQDAISMLNLTDGALGETTSILQRMRQLAVQSANDTYTVSDRQAMQAEFQALEAEIGNIAAYTSFNGLKVLQGQGGTWTAGVNSTTTSTPTNNFTVATSSQTFAVAPAGLTNLTMATTPAQYNLGVPGASSVIVQTYIGGALSRTLAYDPTLANGFAFVPPGSNNLSLNVPPVAGETSVKVLYVDPASLTKTLSATPVSPASLYVTQGGVPVGNAGGPGGNGYYYNAGAGTVSLVGTARPGANAAGGAATTFSVGYVQSGTTTMALNTANPFGPGAILNTLTLTATNTSAGGGPITLTQGTDFTLNQSIIGYAGNTPLYSYSIQMNNATLAALGAGAYSLNANYNYTYPLTVDPLQLDIQIGANSNEKLGLSLPPLSLGTIGLSTAAIDTLANAQSAIAALDTAISTVSTQRAQLGANANQLEHHLAVDSGQELAQTQAESAIRDTDMAHTMSDLTRLQILQGSGIQVLSNANRNSEYLLTLLK